MKIHLAWIRVTATATATATIAVSAAISGQLAQGQGLYAPYGMTQQYSNVAPYGVQPTQPPVYPSATRGALHALDATGLHAGAARALCADRAERPTCGPSINRRNTSGRRCNRRTRRWHGSRTAR